MEDIKRCSGCMNIKTEGQFCSHCGYDTHCVPENPLFIKPDTVIGDYLYGKVLGHGGFGITYLGYDIKNNRKVAIKEYLPAELATRHSGSNNVTIYTGEKEVSFRSGIDKFKKEADMLKNFSDFPGIVDGYDIFEANNTAYFVMEYIEGITLKEYVAQKGGRVPFETVRAVLVPVIDALGEMHRKDIIHRDISPDNIYITEDKRVKLLDFGAARQAVHDQNKGLSVILKHGFTPKEQYFTKGNQGPWTDVYALGATAYYMLTGTVPQPALDRLEQDKLVPLSSFVPGIDERIDAVIRKALAIEEVNRYQTVKDFKAALINPASVPVPQMPVKQADYGHTQPMAQAQAMPPLQQAPMQQVVQPQVQQPIYSQVSEPTKPKKKKGLVVALVLVTLLLLGVVGAAATLLLMPRVPDLSDMTEEEAIKELKREDFDYDIEYDTDDKVDAGEVIDQEPESDKRTFKKYVEFTVSQGPEEIEIPDLTGKTEEEATEELEKSGFEVKSKKAFSASEVGTVVAVDPSIGEVVKNGSDITIFVSEGVDPSWLLFEDETLESALVKELGLDIDLTKEKLTQEMVAETTYLNIDDYGISSLVGLEAFSALQSLSCVGNDLTVVEGLPSTITYLDLSYNKLTSLDVSNCTGLVDLYLDENNMVEFPKLPSAIQYLSLYSNDIKDISPLSSLTSLYGLDLSYNRIEDFSPLDVIYNQLGYCYTDGNIAVYQPIGVDVSTDGDIDWADSITPTYAETDVFYQYYPTEDESYISFTYYDIPTVSAETDVIYYGPYVMGDETFELYYFEYEDVTVDFYFDPTTQVCTFYDVYGYEYPFFGEYDLLCQYDTYDRVIELFGAPTDVLYGDNLVFFDYATVDAVYSFVFGADGTLDFLRVFNYDYYYGY